MVNAISPSAALADLRKAIPPVAPAYIGFASVGAALAYQEKAGGWIFAPDQAAGAIWFDGALFTASAVIKHPAAKGSGRLL